nr:uncharacterized protein LOC106690840 [Halyomorpha halys]
MWYIRSVVVLRGHPQSYSSVCRGGVSTEMKAFVLTCLLAAVTASAVVPTAYHYGAYPWGISSYSYANSLLLPHGLAPVSPLVVAPHAALVPGHSVPVDTPEVAAAKIAHFAAHAEARSRGKRAAAYYGPPAPLNRDGTVAFTPEIQQANAVHTAAYQQEFQRLQSAAALAAAHPDRTSPPSPDYNPGNNGQYNSQSYDNGQYNPAWNNPAPSYNSAPAPAPAWNNPAPAPAWNNAAPAPAWNNPAPSYNAPAPSWNNQGSYNPQPPAPLNADGTAAYTREYQAIAASHQQAYHQALSRTKRSVHLNPDGTVAPTPEVAAATAAHLAAVHGAAARTAGVYHVAGPYSPYTYGHAYHYGAAPLNPDGTVAETPEVRAAAAVHASYVAKQFSDLAHQEALALSAGPGEGEGAYYSGQWAGHVVAPYAGHYAGYWPAAPLNADGTVAPTPEVAAATAAHLAAHAHARIGHAHHYYCVGLVSTLRYDQNVHYQQYHGPPAPLNPDGTVAFTPEYEHIRDEHMAAFEREYQNIRNSIQAAQPYNVPNFPKKYGEDDQGLYLPEIHEEDTYGSIPAPADEGLYYPEVYEKPYSSQYDNGQYRPHVYKQGLQAEEQYNSLPSNQDSSYRPNYVSAKLNADGTVAHTPEYNAIASSFLAYHQALSRHRRSTERYQGPPAPLNHDFTVDYTPEVKHVNAAHFTAVANQFKRLQETAAIAAAHPDRTSPPSKDYNPQELHLGRKKRSYGGQYSPQQQNARHYDDGQYKHHFHKHDDGQYKPHLHRHDEGQYKPHLHQVVDYNAVPFQPAPLNADGTVAHVPEYHAIAASHLAAHHNALSSVTHYCPHNETQCVISCVGLVSSLRYEGNVQYERYHGPPAPLNPDGTVAFTPEYEHIRDEHMAAFEREYQNIRNSIQAAQPYNVPNFPKKYGEEDQGLYLPEIHEEDTYGSIPAPADEGLYYPEVYEKPYSSQYDNGQYRPHVYKQGLQAEEQYNSPPSNQDSSYRPNYVSAKLNADGTVAHTPEYNAIASSFLAYHQALSRHRRSTERYQGPPAPLNHDFTVDYTPEIKQLPTSSRGYRKQQLLQQHILIALLPLLRTTILRNCTSEGRSVPTADSTTHSSRTLGTMMTYKPHLHRHDEGQYKPHLHQVVDYHTVPFQPAPLNPDGTVAHVPEFHAIAASHLAAHHQALSSTSVSNMINNSLVVLCLLGIAAGSPFRYNAQDDHYHGPPAPLNPDGTVAFTPEYEHIRDEHSAFFDREYNRIKIKVDAGDPHGIKYQTYTHGSEDQGQYLPQHDSYESNVEDDGLYNPELHEVKYTTQYDDGQYRPHLYEQEQRDEDQYNSPPSTQGTSYRPAYVPASLNADGTVAHTPGYNAIASSFLSRHRRSTERYQGPPAPLNQDLTVDYTPEIKHVSDAHFTAVANQFKRLQDTAALAAAHPDRTSPPSKDYNPQNNGHHNLFESQPLHQELHLGRKKRSYTAQYSPQQQNTRNYDDGQYKHHSHKHDDGQYKPHLHRHDEGQYKPHLHQVVDYHTVPFQPAPLNPDGTVAHVPEYHAIAASHLAAHHNALSSVAH